MTKYLASALVLIACITSVVFYSEHKDENSEYGPDMDALVGRYFSLELERFFWSMNKRAGDTEAEYFFLYDDLAEDAYGCNDGTQKICAYGEGGFIVSVPQGIEKMKQGDEWSIHGHRFILVQKRPSYLPPDDTTFLVQGDPSDKEDCDPHLGVRYLYNVDSGIESFMFGQVLNCGKEFEIRHTFVRIAKPTGWFEGWIWPKIWNLRLSDLWG